jgi:hypothetical protein
MTLSDRLSTALAVRLNLQISVSSLPVVDEAMDAPLGRWIDSAPLPPESADGEDATFEVRLASDFSHVTFAMHGLPGGVIPKLGTYLRQSGLSADQEQVIDGLGGALEPPRVGSFVAIEAGALTTGWLFPTHLRLDAVAESVASVATSPLLGWLAGRGVTGIAGLWQAIGAAGHTDVWVAPPGTSPDSAVAAAAELFAAMGGGELPAPVRDAALGGEPPRVVVRLDGAPRLALVIGGGDLAALRAIAGAAGVAVDDGLERLVATLGASELAAVEYAVTDGRPAVSAVVVPSGAERRPASQPN